ncbi:eukaryotic translation initiation factor 3G1 [Actinidia rufa]|uniref:Eukaryotic translation initiation factor 3G1 n=1 Tax=Actinidia rufa TaxID=165716 RepID=A0A7J0DNP8_9ERIC|nr:eukaryotic translation initiation factor 3G1 [Actinidia rufa]
MGVDLPPVHRSKLRWGDIDEDDSESLDSLLPPREIIGPDENRVKKVTRLSKRAVERRAWSRFGDAVDEDVSARLTMVSTEEILLECPWAPGSKPKETKAAGDPFAQIGKAGAVLMFCRICCKKAVMFSLITPLSPTNHAAIFLGCANSDHWTSGCPYKDLAPQSEGSAEVPYAASGPRKGTYVPPGMRPSTERSGTEMRLRNVENSVRLPTCPRTPREADLHELFHAFGLVSCVYVAVDQKTGMSRGFGFGFVNFVNKEDAKRAINKLNGYNYDNLIF